MSHVTPETARRLKEAGFSQNTSTGFYFVESYTPSGKAREWGELVFKSGIDYMLCGSFRGATTLLHNCHKTAIDAKNAFLAPSATDIMQHLPGWYLAFSKNQFVCLSFDEEGSAPDSFVHENPAEACAKAWFFEQSNAKK